jgi:hypothetical protein
MKALVSSALLLALIAPASAAWASACEGQAAGMSRSPEISAWATGAESFEAAPHFLGTRPSEALSLNAVLLRRQLAGCGPSDQYAGYVPRTAHDNTPWRFNMDAGKKLSAAEFDAWMKSRGVRVAKGRAEPAPEPETAVIEATVVQ